MAGVPRKGLGSWVKVAESEHGGGQLGAPTASAKRDPVCVGQSPAWREPGPDKMPT